MTNSQNNIAFRYPRHFLERRLPLQNLAPAVLPQGEHAVFERLIADGRGVDALHTQLMDEVVGDHQFEDPHSPPVARVVAYAAACSAPEGQPRTVAREIRG